MREDMTDKLMVWVDVETFGLDVEKDPLLEVGIRITDLDLNPVGETLQMLVWQPTFHERVRTADEWALITHSNNGLFEEAAKRGYHPDFAERELSDRLKFQFNTLGIQGKPPMCGSSVGFDRGVLTFRMPKVAKLFGYRNIDISSVKELCKRYNPNVYGALNKYCTKQEQHRVLPDLDDTINEFRFYSENFLFDGRADA